MNLTVYSHNLLLDTARSWEVPRDFADPVLNYLVYGYEPGSCFTAVLANDFFRAVQSSHPNNTVEAFKFLTGWIRDRFPPEAYGNYAAVGYWLDLSPVERREILERQGLIYSEAEEIIMTLEAKPTQEPVLY